MRLLAAVTRALTPLALLAAALGLLLPSPTLAAHSDLLLALLVLATALGISFADLARLREHVRAVLILSLLPLPVLVGAAWLLGQAFTPLVRDGLLAVGLSSAEVASVGLVALAGADATIALGVVTGSLVLAALVGPVAIGWLSASSVHVGSGHLLARFALVVLVPLLVGVAARSQREEKCLKRSPVRTTTRFFPAPPEAPGAGTRKALRGQFCAACCRGRRAPSPGPPSQPCSPAS